MYSLFCETKMRMFCVLCLLLHGSGLVTGSTSATTTLNTTTVSELVTSPTSTLSANDTTSSSTWAEADTMPDGQNDESVTLSTDVTSKTTTQYPSTITSEGSSANCSVPGYECQNNGTCTTNMSTCDCPEGFTGARCEYHQDCDNSSCINEGTCTFYSGYGYRCKCMTGDPKVNCSLNVIKECRDIPPLKFAALRTCIDYIGGYNMICVSDYMGFGCAKSANDNVCTRQGPDYCTNEEYCKPLCNLDQCNGTAACTFTVKPFDDQAFSNNTECIQDFANGYYSEKCDTEELLFDGFDKIRNNLSDCSPYFDTVCTASFGDGDCNPKCNNSDCLLDGWDCADITSSPSLVSGGVVLELKSVDKIKAQKVLGLLLRSRISIEETSLPVPHVYVNISSKEFTTIQSAGRFLAAAFAKLPDLLPVRDVFVCESGSYSANYYDKCNDTCSENCKYGTCHWSSGRCLSGCKPGYHGLLCLEDCSNICPNLCRNSDMCGCERSIWSDEKQACSLFCKPGFYGDQCVQQCGLHCKDGACDMEGTCTSGCMTGYYGTHCKTKCPMKCPNCAPDTGSCNGKCIDGYEGETCQLTIQPPVTDNNGVIIAVVLAIVIILVIIVVAYCCWKQRQSGDYVLEDEEMESPVKKAGTLEANTAMTLNPIGPNMGQSTDMIDLDERPSAGIYTGPPRNTIIENDTSGMTANNLSQEESSANGDILIVTSETKTEASERVSLTIDVGQSAEPGVTEGPTSESKSDDNDIKDEGIPEVNVTLKLDIDQDQVNGNRNDGEGPAEMKTDSDTEINVPLSKSLAPLASEEDILLSKENLLAEPGHEEPTDQDGDQGSQDSSKPSSRKSSTSSKSSKSSSSSNHSDSKSDKDKQTDSGEPTTEI